MLFFEVSLLKNTFQNQTLVYMIEEPNWTKLHPLQFLLLPLVFINNLPPFPLIQLQTHQKPSFLFQLSNKYNMAAFLGLVIFLISLAVPSFATVYTIGDAAGWASGVDYTSWTSGKTFTVGDSLSKSISSISCLRNPLKRKERDNCLLSCLFFSLSKFNNRQ